MGRNKPKEIRYDLLGSKVVENLQKRHFEAYYCQTKEDALKKAIELIPENDVVSWGGSVSIDEIGLLNYVKENRKVIDRDSAKSPEERIELMRQGLLCDTFLMSTNAMTEDGVLVNIDGNGNRVAALCYGPKSVVMIVGINKVCKTLDDAVSRARNIAAPINAQRFNDLKTPCYLKGSCANCKSPESICSQVVITRLSRPASKIKIIVVGEDLGF
ncbi:MAG: lactate utilization protein [Intestinibacter bartlettii]|uniref:lactate utilization protein n=1 Tax=Intestinibacter bartlettii TaxID=261299 RepID=UPI0026F0F8C3|nr:lactate utilization protein [Intestinibacter bartlettii]MDO5010539.1 lactate utilization protein [Intestinibacter bartlettii]